MADIRVRANNIQDNEYIYSIDIYCYKSGSWQSVSQTIPATRVQTYNLDVTFVDTNINRSKGCFIKVVDELLAITYVGQVGGTPTGYDTEAEAQAHTFALPGGFNLLPFGNKSTSGIINDALTQLGDLPVGSRGTAVVMKDIGTARSKLPFNEKGTAGIMKNFS